MDESGAMPQRYKRIRNLVRRAYWSRVDDGCLRPIVSRPERLLFLLWIVREEDDSYVVMNSEEWSETQLLTCQACRGVLPVCVYWSDDGSLDEVWWGDIKIARIEVDGEWRTVI